MAVIVEEITASAAVAARVEVGFIAMCQIPIIDDLANPGEMIPKFPNAKAWLRQWIKEDVLRASRAGYRKLAASAAETITVDELDD